MSLVISVIIPNYNHATYLKERIESVLNQTYQNFEIIILDDCSTDNSKEIIEYYRDNKKVKHIVYNEINSGSPFIQWAKGVALARGTYVWIAESDDYASLTFLETLISGIEKEPSVVMAYSNSDIVEGGVVIPENRPSLFYNKLFNTNRYSEGFVNDGEDELINYMGGFCTVINASSCLFLRSAFPADSYGFYRFKYCGDWFIWIAMCTKGKVLYIKDALNYFRIHADSTVNKFSRIRKAKELYRCLLEARKFTNGKSKIPDECLSIIFNMWTYYSLSFFIRNFSFRLVAMHVQLDKAFSTKFFLLFKNYFKSKFQTR